MKRRILLVAVAGGAIAFCAAAASVAYALRSSHRIVDGFAEISGEMTRSAVEELLGPPGDYQTGPVKISGDRVEIHDLQKNASAPNLTHDSWQTDLGTLIVTYDVNDCATSKQFWRGERVKQTPLQYATWWVECLRERWFPTPKQTAHIPPDLPEF
jgi:hypothetical protein